MKKIKDIYKKISDISAEITQDHVGAYAAQTAFFSYSV